MTDFFNEHFAEHKSEIGHPAQESEYAYDDANFQITCIRNKVHAGNNGTGSSQNGNGEG